jgi:hypothetical protein
VKILITGTSGLAQGLLNLLELEHTITCVSRSTGYDILEVDTWASNFLDYDMVINNAYDGLGQLKVLEYFYSHWHLDANKHIINIGSRASYFPRSEQHLDSEYWPYRLHKQALEKAWEKMVNSQCDIKLINPGPLDTDLIRNLEITKMPVTEAAECMSKFIFDPRIKRVDLWL